MTEIKDDLLQNVNGGAMNWKQFGQKFLNVFYESTSIVCDEYYQLASEIKIKNYIEVAAIVISLISKGDELIIRLISECV